MPEAYIVDAVRTPLGKGKAQGSLAAVHPTDLLGAVIEALVRRTGAPGDAVDDVIAGCVSQVGEQTRNIARNAALAAGLPVEVPGTTVDRQCGSSQQAVHFAAQGVLAGAYDLVVACGVESMSRIPMRSALLGQDPYGQAVARRFPEGLVPQGVSAELVAAKWGLTREDLDGYALRSHRRAAEATESGAFDREKIAVTAGDSPATADESIRPGTSPEALAALRPAFASPEWTDRYPEIDWKVTAGNSSTVNDGAAGVLIASENAVRRYGLRPRARFTAFSVCGDDPILMLTAVIPATQRVLARAGLRLDDIDLFEVNEAFAAVPLAWQREMGVPEDRLNVHGGAIALGHPLGASGARIMTTLLCALERAGARYGLQTMCEAGGLANATIIERLG